MSDGNVTPLGLDGMAAFPHAYDRKLVRLIRNREDRKAAGAGSNPVTPVEAGSVYDPAAGGGTSTLDFDPRRGRLVRDFVSLKGIEDVDPAGDEQRSPRSAACRTVRRLAVVAACNHRGVVSSTGQSSPGSPSSTLVQRRLARPCGSFRPLSALSSTLRLAPA